jgi:hypothetical protein
MGSSRYPAQGDGQARSRCQVGRSDASPWDSAILTFDRTGFIRYPGIEAVNPAQVKD